MSRRPQNSTALLARCPECQRGPGRPCVDIGRHILRHAHASRHVAGHSFAQRALARVDSDFDARLAAFRESQAAAEAERAARMRALERTFDQLEQWEDLGC